jgi:hypothetical protein
LFDQIVANHLARVRIEAALAGQEDPLTTVTPGEYGPAGAGSLSELTRAFMDGGLLEVG